MSEVAEALAAANVTALTPKAIDPVLLEYQRRYSPLVYTIPTRDWATNVYYFNQRTARGAGGFVTDGGARSVNNSTYVQNSFTIKLLQTVGAVTGFAQAITKDLIGDLKRAEIEGSAQSLIWDVETAMLWGNATSTASGVAPQYDGLDYLVATYSGSTQNAIDEAAGTFSLAMLDQLIDMVETNAAMPVQSQEWAFIVSSTAQSKAAQLLLSQQRYTEVEVKAGLIVPSYRNIPFIKSSFLANRSIQMGTVTTSTATTGGSIASGTTYYYQVSAVIARQGEVRACTEVSITVGTTTNTNTVSLAFSTPTGVDSAGPLLYKVYRSTTTGTEVLIGVVDATDTAGTATTTIVDTGTGLLTNAAGTTTVTTYASANTGQKPRGSAQEDMFLVPLNRDFMLRPYVRDMTVIPLAATTSAPDVLPYAIVTDTCLAVRAPKYVGRLGRVAVSL